MTIAPLAIVSYDNSNNVPFQIFYLHTYAYNHLHQNLYQSSPNIQQPWQQPPPILLAASSFPFVLNQISISLLFFTWIISRYDNSYNPHHQHNHHHPKLITWIYDNISPLASPTGALQEWVDNRLSTDHRYTNYLPFATMTIALHLWIAIFWPFSFYLLHHQNKPHHFPVWNLLLHSKAIRSQSINNHPPLECI